MKKQFPNPYESIEGRISSNTGQKQDTGEYWFKTLLGNIVGVLLSAIVVLVLIFCGFYILNSSLFHDDETKMSDVVQPALGVVAGIGAVAYLVIAYRKQKYTESGFID
ncbi:hypothetical protein JTE88_05075 [Arcanobacterium phocisimile]|uniref:LPXTG-motif cell wall anchor domain-containing protein n=1 Tax=Arcanobacterium phocisimile TaxID=1302235 RepID=A0ABX7IEB6_9ACTO|nr:hypothetical protein [Arcanobacterium phocisimile]QRV01488.1 hypothetical protein JTE88_05075 [Arcanobacterium phocisimile]